MEQSEWGWWGKTDQERIIQVLQGLNPEEA